MAQLSPPAPEGASDAARSPECGALPNADAGPSRAAMPRQVADRYLVHEELGRGGFAVVYRVHDTIRDRELALKQFAVPDTHPSFSEQSAAFEREFHTLMQLSHPRIIEVYDFGSDAQGRYYTMELLDGGDLKQCAPMPWRDACALIHDICSSLALLHSRRLVHRDVSPGNVRRTRGGAAKLIDFGALVPMGPTANVTGTPPFVAPEALHRSALDGRTDLFSLGATFYYALTGRVPYAARSLGSLQEAWRARPAPPSAVATEVPAALDALVLSLVSLDPAARPYSAFEVMQRLTAIAGLEHGEEVGVSQAYLATPVLVGRDGCLAQLREAMDGALQGRGGSRVLIEGVAGLGRSRLLDACALEGKIAGAAVFRVNAATCQSEGQLGVGRALAAQVLETLPDLAQATAEQEGVSSLLFETAELDADASQPLSGLSLATPKETSDGRSAFQTAIARWLVGVAGALPLAILIDDAEKADEASTALLATLALAAPPLRMALVLTTDPGAPVADTGAFQILRRECASIALTPLTAKHLEVLVVSLFGDVPNAGRVADRLFQAAGGNPRETMEIAQSLITSGVIRYGEGNWVLPPRLLASDLPTHAGESCRKTVDALSAPARMLGQLFALASHPTLRRSDLARGTAELSSEQLDAALTELSFHRVIADDGQAYRLARAEWSQALTVDVEAAVGRERHRQLASIYGQDAQFAMERVHHLLEGGREAEGLDLLQRLLLGVSGSTQGVLSLTRMGALQVASILDRALACAERQGRTRRELHQLRYSLMAISVVTDESCYVRVSGDLLAQLQRDSGFSDLEQFVDVPDPAARVMRALAAAGARHASAPDDERVWDPKAAIRGLAHYVVVSIAIGSRMQDTRLLASLPALLEPFSGLSPTLHAIWKNATATAENTSCCRPEEARRLWQEVLDALSNIPASELSYVEALRNAIVYGIGLIEARMGFVAAERTARSLGDAPMQEASALSLRKVARLHKGDFGGAERFRKRAEQAALRGNLRSMFSSTLQAELAAYALARDLSGVREVARAIEPLADRFAGWQPYKDLAEGYVEQTCGQLEQALSAFDRGLARCRPSDHDAGACLAWPPLEASAVEVLVGLERAEEARQRGERALSMCAERQIHSASFAIRRAMALAEARLGDYAGASSRLEDVIKQMVELKIAGLELGATFEARARIAIWFEDVDAIASFGKQAAREYRYGEGSSLGARYERLMDEARIKGGAALPQLVGFQTQAVTCHTPMLSVHDMVRQRLSETVTTRTELGLRCSCCARSAAPRWGTSTYSRRTG